MTGSYTATERRTLQRLLLAGEALRCPACGGDVVQQPVERPEAVSYVRHRAVVICTACRRTAALDVARS